jgi:hypothetical protein
MSASDQLATTPYPWEKWEKLPREERKAMLAEAHKQQVNQEWLDELTRKAPIPLDFSDQANVDAGAETEAIGHHGGPHPLAPDEDDALTGRSIEEYWNKHGGIPRMNTWKQELIQNPSEYPDPDLDLSQKDAISGAEGDYRAGIEIDITIEVQTDFGYSTEYFLDKNFRSQPEIFTPLETAVVVPLLT